MKPVVVVDGPCVCYRSMFSIGNLSFEERPTGVIFGFLSVILQLADKFDYPKFVFTWDSRKSIRRSIYPNYKRREQERASAEVLELLEIARPQFVAIRTRVLPLMGFRNNFIQTGLEADDLIARTVEAIENGKDRRCIIATIDNDLYQLLSPSTSVYNLKTKRLYTIDDFHQDYGIRPKDWVTIKTLAGCPSDGIAGIAGVGEKTAILFLQGKLKGKKLELISKERDRITQINDPLVRLPRPETSPVELVEREEFSFRNFETICMEYGFRSFLKKGIYEKWKMILQ